MLVIMMAFIALSPLAILAGMPDVNSDDEESLDQTAASNNHMDVQSPQADESLVDFFELIAFDAGSSGTVLEGTEATDRISGGQGSETILGHGGDDQIFGFGEENPAANENGEGDHIHGGGGDDVVVGTSSDDIIFGGDGNDTLIGGLGEDSLVGGQGNDSLVGVRSHWDDLLDNDQTDLLDGGIGDDTIVAGNGDQVYGGGGEDNIVLSGHNIEVHDFDPSQDILAIGLPYSPTPEDLIFLRSSLMLEEIPDETKPGVIIRYSDDDEPICIVYGAHPSEIDIEGIHFLNNSLLL